MANDVLLTDNNDLDILNGDFIIGESIKQELKLLLTTKKGEWKEHPMAGANLEELIKQREGRTAAIREAKIQIRDDGMRLKKLTIDGIMINIDAERL